MSRWLVAAVAILAGAPVAAEAKAAPADEEVCLSIGHPWSGWPADVARIVDTPVPESFRAELAKTECARWQLIDESLIDWHLRFGTPATTTAALEYLAAEYDRRRDLGAVKPDRWLDLARSAVRAAELYESTELLALSDRYASRIDFAEAHPGLRAHYEGNAVRVALRRTVLRALLTRSVADLAAASEAIRARSTPAIEALRNWPAGREVCGDRNDPDYAPVAAACGTASDFERDAIGWWEASARLALAEVRPGDCGIGRRLGAVDNALALMSSQIEPNDLTPRWPDYWRERMVSLLLSLTRQAASPACGRDDGKSDAKQALIRAERLTPAAIAPAQFRMVAERYGALPAEPGDRWAAAFQVALAHLDEITAATWGPSPR